MGWEQGRVLSQDGHKGLDWMIDNNVDDKPTLD